MWFMICCSFSETPTNTCDHWIWLQEAEAELSTDFHAACTHTLHTLTHTPTQAVAKHYIRTYKYVSIQSIWKQTQVTFRLQFRRLAIPICPAQLKILRFLFMLRFSSSNLHVPSYCPRKPFFRPLRLRAWSVWTQCPRNLNWILLWLTLDAVCLRGLCGKAALPVSFHYLLDSSCGFLIPMFCCTLVHPHPYVRFALQRA